jgi:hypothetical protein
MDNPMTRSWADTMQRRVVSPVERAVVDEQRLRNALSAHGGSLVGESGYMRPDYVEYLQAMKGSPLDREQMAVLADMIERQSGPEARVAIGKAAVLNALDAAAVDGVPLGREQLMERVSLLGDGRMLTPAAEVVHGVLGSAPVAYGAVLGGGALALKGAMDVYARLQAGEPVSREEKDAADRVLAAQKRDDAPVA